MSKLERLSFPKTDINLEREIETEKEMKTKPKVKEEFEKKTNSYGLADRIRICTTMILSHLPLPNWDTARNI